MKMIFILCIGLILSACSSTHHISQDRSEQLTRQYVASQTDQFIQYCFYTTVLDNPQNRRFVGYAKDCFTECLGFEKEEYPTHIVHKMICNKLHKNRIKDNSQTNTMFEDGN